MLYRALISAFLLSTSLAAQGAKDEYVVRVDPPELTLPIGQTSTLSAEIVDIGGRPGRRPGVLLLTRAAVAAGQSRGRSIGAAGG